MENKLKKPFFYIYGRLSKTQSPQWDSLTRFPKHRAGKGSTACKVFKFALQKQRVIHSGTNLHITEQKKACLQSQRTRRNIYTSDEPANQGLGTPRVI